MNALFDPKYHIALEASAGTGKTYTLTLRLLNILLRQIPLSSPQDDPTALQEVVALTFTNKAAQEMKERLLGWIKIAIQAERYKNEEKYAPLFALASDTDKNADLTALKERAKRLYQLLLDHFSLLEISTLDSFMASIIRLFPFELGIRLDVEIADEARERDIFNEALDRLLVEISSDTELKETILEAYRQKLPSSSNIRTWLKNIFTDFLQHQEALEEFAKQTPKDNTLSNLKRLEQEVWQALETFIATLKPQVKHKRAKETLKKMEEVRFLKDLLKINLLSKPSLKKHNYFKNLPKDCEDAFFRLKQTLEAYLLASNHWQVGLLFKLFRRFYRHYSEIKKRENCITFADLSALTYQLLVKQGLFEEKRDFFYYRLDRKVKHLLLDEFQDTNIIQWQVLEPLVNELIAGIGTRDVAGSFFYVGDKKQAIYRFRGGEPELFDYVKKRFPGFIRAETLPKNYRSAGGLVEFVNKIGEFLNKKFSFPFSPQVPETEKKDAPYHILFEMISPEEETELGKTIVKKIKTLRRIGLSYQEIAILVRRRQMAERFLPSLKEAGIPVQTETEVLLLAAPAIKAVVSLLRYLDDTHRKLDLIHFLKSLGKADKELEGVALEERFEEETLKEIRNMVDLVPLPTLLERIYHTFSLFELYKDRANLWQLLEIAYQFERRHPRSLRAFLDYLEANQNHLLQAKGALSEAVQVMTVHKAKGLEFEAVILPEITYDCLDDRKNRLIFLYDETDFSLKGVYMNPRKNEAELNPTLNHIKKYALNRQLQDELNLFYVALTRAKTALYLLGQPQRRGKSFSLPSHCWASFVASALGKDIKAYLNSLPTCIFENGALPVYKTQIRNSNLRPVFVWKEPKRLLTSERIKEEIKPTDLRPPRGEQKFGEAFHYVMSYLRTERDSLARAITKAKAVFGLYLKEEEWEDIRQRAKMVLNHPSLKPLFKPGIKVLNEAPLLSHQGSLKAYRADRIVFTDKKIVVIDYKTGVSEGRETHVQQVNEYKTLLQKLYPQRQIEGYLVYVLKDRVEIQSI
jgi:ribonucleoside-diphosphate reductase beta chain/exodeoxyribonuclease V beta subunit